MFEVIVTLVCPEIPECVCTDRSMCEHLTEPAHTEIYRFEFESRQSADASIAWLQAQCLAGGKVGNIN